MLRPLPTYNIEGTDFIVDVKKQELQQKDYRSNIIPFFEMQYKGDHYRLTYDAMMKGYAIEGFTKDHDIVPVVIPQMKDLDPEGMAKLYHLTAAQVKARSDFDIIVDPEVYDRRREGQLPQLNIGEDQYQVNLRLHQLELTATPYSWLAIGDMAMIDSGERFQFLYHQKHKVLYEPPADLLSMPKDVVLVTIPNRLVLDPYAVARENNFDVKGFLIKYPPSDQFTATISPLENTLLKTLVEENRKQYKQSDDDKTDRTPKQKK